MLYLVHTFLCLLHVFWQHVQQNSSKTQQAFFGRSPRHPDSHLSQGAVLKLLCAMGERAATCCFVRCPGGRAAVAATRESNSNRRGHSKQRHY